MLDLHDITLVCFENRAIEKARELIGDMERIAQFGDVRWYNDHRTLLEFQKVEFGIGDPCKTSHLLTVHLDGFIINPESWNPEWLQYDYIGAPWPEGYLQQFNKSWVQRVGNSGFSLRSTRFTRRAKAFMNRYPVFDLLVSQVARHALENEGFKFAPPEVAAQFSKELPTEFDVEKPFGFHGVWPIANNPPGYYQIGTCAKQAAEKAAKEVKRTQERVILLTPRDPENHRTKFAQTTHTGAEYHRLHFFRTASDMLDEKGCYYINDFLDLSLQLSGDIFVFVNNDVALVPEWRDIVVPAVKQHGCFFSQRRDVAKFDRKLNLADINTSAPPYVGSDVFAFTPDWWMSHRDNFPMLPLGYEGWDAILTYLMCKSGFQRGQIIAYHELHGTAWWNQTKNEQHPAILENRRRQIEWAKKNGVEHFVGAPHGFLWKSDIFCFK